MGQDGDRAALIYHHASQGADRKIADALDARVGTERPDDDDVRPAYLSRRANGPLMARHAASPLVVWPIGTLTK